MTGNDTHDMATVLFSYKLCGFGGGAEKNIVDVAEHIARRHRVLFLIAGGYVDPRMSALGKVYYFPSRGRIALFPIDLLYLAYVALREKVDVVHAHHRYPAFLATLLRRVLDIKLLTTVHNHFPDKARISLWGDRAIAVSQGVKDWLVGECGLDPVRIATIYNGIHEPERYPAGQLDALRAELSVPNDVPVLCSVGRLTKQKNYPNLFAALAQMAQSPWMLLLVGDGEDRGALTQIALSLGLDGRIHFLGHRLDVDKIMQISDLFVMSSAWEGFPYVIVEALANTLPIVSTAVGGVAEGVVDGVTGFTVRPGDPEQLAGKIKLLLDDPVLRATLSKNGRELFRVKFQIDAMFAQVDREYEALLSAK
ncbi:MAG TPA: glycosyltransferase family 1 protein [Candidatus Acetothermia bacterium]|nr:glycosyltransferase family 1 protein [Candidatus Acetothermia bacterium]